jgi:hypothetical protein
VWPLEHVVLEPLFKELIMRLEFKAAVAALGLIALAGCSKSASGCAGLTLNAQPSGMVGRHLSVTVTNTGDDPKLVTLSVTGPDGSAIGSDGPFRVSSKDVVERDEIAYLQHSQANSQEEMEAEGFKVAMKCE